MIKDLPQVNSENTSPPTLWQKTLTGVGVRFALIWIYILIVVAVFAPLFANTAPLILYKNSQLSFPFLTYINFEDCLFIIGFALALIIYFCHQKLKLITYLILSVITIITLTAAAIFINPPELVTYSDFRSIKYLENVQFKLSSPIPYSPTDYLRDFGATSLEEPFSVNAQNTAKNINRYHIMGTDENGADVFSRMIHASRIALSIGIIATGIAMSIGIFLGGFMGFFSGWVDILGMRIVEVFEAIPALFLLLAFVAFFGSNLYIMMVIIGLTSWSGYARYIRAEFLKLREQDFVQASIVSGLPLTNILFRQMLPNGVAPLLVAMSFGIASAILAETTLSFLGLGPVDAPSWGQMLNQAVKSSSFNWWLALFPGGAIFLTVFTYTLLGEAFRDALDPKINHKVKIKILTKN